MVKLDSIMKDFNKKPDQKKPEKKKSIEIISGSQSGEVKSTAPISDLIKPKTDQTQIGSVVPKAQVVISTPPVIPSAPPVSASKPFVLPPVVEQKKQEKMRTDDFDYSEEKPENKHAGLIYGLKGSGKTSLAFSFPGEHVCFSFDKKSTTIKENMSENDKKRIHVYDATRYLDKSSSESWLISSKQSWKYICNIFEKIPNRPDWVVVDGGEVLETMLEMVMRYVNNLQPYQGIQNLNIWKERRRMADHFYRMCFNFSKKGVIWTSYVHIDPLYKDGQIVSSKEVPKWLETVMMETEFLIKTERETDKTRQTFYATVETSKWKVIPCSPRTDITETGIKKLSRGDL